MYAIRSYYVLEVRARAADRLHFVLPDHFGKRKAQFRCAHRASQRHEHHAAVIEMAYVGIRGIDHRGRIEMAIVVTLTGDTWAASDGTDGTNANDRNNFV